MENKKGRPRVAKTPETLRVSMDEPYKIRLLDLANDAGLDPWPQNALRHSRVSYRLAQTSNAAQTAIEDGHSEAMLHAHYSALVTPEAAERYFAIRPGVENFPSDSTGQT